MVSSRALGERRRVAVKVYDTLAEMRTAAERYNGGDNADTLGVTQTRCDQDDRAVSVLVRLVRGYLGTQIVSHEMHHAATAWFGASLPDAAGVREHLNHHNEPFAHLFSDLMVRLVDRLYDLGYYPSTSATEGV